MDPGGASEYFILCGVLIRSHRRQELREAVRTLKVELGLAVDEELHFRKLCGDAQRVVVRKLAQFKAGLIAVVSNKRNMRGYRNLRVEAKALEVVRDRSQPQRYNWFYNHLFRYLLETASAECSRWSVPAYGCRRPIAVMFSHRRSFRYSQTRAYLHKLKVSRPSPTYFNNKRQISWGVVDPNAISSERAKSEPGLQFADCVASALYRAIDEDWFGRVNPEYLEQLAPRFVRAGHTPADYGFKFLPVDYKGPLSADQRRGLLAVGERMQTYKKPRGTDGSGDWHSSSLPISRQVGGRSIGQQGSRQQNQRSATRNLELRKRSL